jgi:hypothetical protein
MGESPENQMGVAVTRLITKEVALVPPLALSWGDKIWRATTPASRAPTDAKCPTLLRFREKPSSARLHLT